MCDWMGWKLEPTSTAAERPTIECVEPRAQQGWQCPRCGRINAPWVESCSCQMPTYVTTKWYTNVPSYCQGCSNHPSNGGSGICHCILGGTKITCSTDIKS